MKTCFVLPAVFSFAILGVAAGFGVSRFSREPRSTPPSATASDMIRLEERLSHLEERLSDLARLAADVDLLKIQKSEARPTEPAMAAGPGASEEQPSASSVAGEEARPSKLERWLETQGMRGDFEGLVSKVYEQARSTRRQREQEEADQRAKEMKALSEGPYGKFNYRVNSLAQKLSLDARQKDYLFNLLSKYDEKRQEALSQLGPVEGDTSPERVKEHMDHAMRVQREFNEQFENELLLGLNAKQQEAFKDLSEQEKGTDGEFVKLISAADGAKIFTATGDAMRFGIRQAFLDTKAQPNVQAPPQKK